MLVARVDQDAAVRELDDRALARVDRVVANLLILDRAALIAVAGTLGLALGLNVGREAASVS